MSINFFVSLASDRRPGTLDRIALRGKAEEGTGEVSVEPTGLPDEDDAYARPPATPRDWRKLVARVLRILGAMILVLLTIPVFAGDDVFVRPWMFESPSAVRHFLPLAGMTASGIILLSIIVAPRRGKKGNKPAKI